MNHTAQLEAVAAAALAWNRARLARIAIAKRVPQLLHPQHGTASRALDAARKTEAQAKARLRKACAAADPASLTLEVEACEVIEAVALLACHCAHFCAQYPKPPPVGLFCGCDVGY